MKKVAVIFGSRSAEHDISIVTAYNAIIEPLKLSDKYEPVAVYISKKGDWYTDKAFSSISFFTDKNYEQKLAKMQPIAISFKGGLKLIGKNGRGKALSIDIAFPATHGTYGEDGSLMGLLRMAKVPFVGCDLEASVIAMDKGLTKTVVVAAGLKSNQYQLFDKRFFESNQQEMLTNIEIMAYPLFVKPVHLGSSIAISKVKDRTELGNALELAFHYDDAVIVEEAVSNLIEITVPIMGNHQPQAAMAERPLDKESDFFDFETKYLGGQKKGQKPIGGKTSQGSYSQIPAEISKKLYKECIDTALAAYKAIKASGIARVDLLVDAKSQDVYVNEINPLPGSLYAHNWRQAGLSNLDLVHRLLELAEERYLQNNSVDTVFITSFLAQF